MKHFVFACSAALFLCLSVPSHVFAQVNATVGGTVTDASGAVIATVAVSAKNNSTGIVTNSTTNGSGAYEFASLQPGTYTVTASISGFKTATFNNVALGQGQQVRLNFNMEVAAAGETVSVVAEADTVLATTSASVGGTLNLRDVSNLPVASRNVLDLVTLTPGVIGVQGTFTAAGQTVPVFAGTATGNVNTTRDGMTTNDGRYNNSNGAYSGIFTSPDMVEEVRVSTNSIDPALGRGSAQVQMLTRSGGNDYHGALFYTNANSALGAQTYFQNLQGQPKDYYNRNQYGGRLGGPIKKNKAFFFALFDNQRYLQKVNVVSTVLTAEARQGIFRYLTAGSPGGTSRRNGNAFSSTPSVDINGNVLKSAGGVPLFMNQFNLFSDVKDPNRTKIDPVWVGPQLLTRLPLPNNWTVGDGLNTAGYQFQRRESGIDGATGQSPSANRDHLTLRFDYQINDKNKVNFVMSREHDGGVSSQSGQLFYPAGYIGDVQRRPRFYSAAWTNVITPSLLNEFRFGYKRDTWEGSSAFDQGGGYSGVSSDSLTQSAKDARASFPTINGQFQYIAPSNTFLGTQVAAGATTTTNGQYAQMNVASPRLTYSPMIQFADTVSWNRNSHAFQGGFDLTREYSQSSNSGGTQTTRPSVSLGVGPTQVPNINSTNFGGLNANDITTAQDILANLAGTVASISQQYWINTPTDTNWSDYTKNVFFYREHHANQWASFFKDNWKVTRNLTVNLGIRYDFYGTPYEIHGLGGKVVNPLPSTGQLTTIKFVNANSPNPDETIYNNDWNNFAPSIGIAYQVPWFKRSTVLRAGYGINYTFAVDFLGLNTNIGNVPGTILNTANPVSGYVNIQGLAASGLLPVSTQGAQPFAPVPLTNRSAALNPYDQNLRTPYIQSFNATIQREITSSLTVDVSYIGNKATKLVTGRQINDVNIVDNGFLNAFNATRAGGNAPLFDTLLNGVNIGGVGVVGQNGLTGSSALRRFTTTNAFIANGQVGNLANFLNTTAALGGLPGTILRKNNLPENFFVINPQFGSMAYQSNNGNSTYNAGQVHFSQRLTHGLSAQGSYTFSKTLGDNTIRDENNLRLSKGLLNIDRTHVFQEAVSFLVPFGKGGTYLTNVPRWADEAIGGWQISSGASWASGVPLSFTGLNTLNQYANVGIGSVGTADLMGQLPDGFKQVTKGANVVSYFPTLTTKAAPVPNFGTGSDATALAGRYTNQVVVDQSGNIILANSQPGTTGNLAVNTPLLRGPGQLSFNGAVSKLFTITEGIKLSFRADVINLLNKPQWGNPITDINSASFGRINTATGNRTVTLNARIDF